MLTLPSPKDADTMDGCPLVELPDSFGDVGYFLRALFDYEFFNPYPARTTFAILSGILRMSHKYEVEGLRKRALAHFSSGYSTVLAQSPLVKANQSWAHCGNYISIIALARQVSADWIIPIALYRLCAEFKEEEIIGGVVYQGPFFDATLHPKSWLFYGRLRRSTDAQEARAARLRGSRRVARRSGGAAPREST
ncbi:hypothetical protein DFH09DRAFT_550422 [Mycena vulgaris]|nr:hypothetical protein DFH09DRAFT_550422 [Mycena vulgaris]